MAVNSSGSGFDPNRQISRRRLLRRVGQGSILAGTLTWVAPIVMTIDPAGAASGSNPPQTPSSSVKDLRVTPPDAPSGTLPRTGSNSTTPLVITGGSLVAAGAAALLASDQITRDRRRRQEPEAESTEE
jgi:LPXTG-motif cell wall-anchored protein